jgi:hypothetical protein
MSGKSIHTTCILSDKINNSYGTNHQIKKVPKELYLQLNSTIKEIMPKQTNTNNKKTTKNKSKSPSF